MSTKRCYYETLEVERNADETKLKSAFRKLAMKWHPDKNPGDATSEVRFKEINEAYSILSDPQKRARYDQFGHAGVNGGGGGGEAICGGRERGSEFVLEVAHRPACAACDALSSCVLCASARWISMRCTLSSGIADQLTLPRSIGLRRWPSSRISVLLPAVSPKPRMSIVESMPRLP